MRTNDAPSAPGGVRAAPAVSPAGSRKIKSGRLLLLLPLLPERRDELVHQVRMRPAVAAATLREGEVLLVFAVVGPLPGTLEPLSLQEKRARAPHLHPFYIRFPAP